LFLAMCTDSSASRKISIFAEIAMIVLNLYIYLSVPDVVMPYLKVATTFNISGTARAAIMRWSGAGR
jgi:small basic protein